MANINDVARLADVSIASVSRYFSKPELLSKRAYGRISAAVAELNYHPNALARNLLKSRSGNVMVLVNDITNPFISQVITEADKAAQARGYSVLLGITHHCAATEEKYIEQIRSKVADGFLQLSATQRPRQMAREQCIPYVNLLECPHEHDLPSVQIDNVAAARDMTQLLIDQGHRDIACLKGQFSDDYPSPVTTDRVEGFCQALNKNGLTMRPEWMLQGDYSPASGVEAARQLLSMSRRPSAVFCANDYMAIGLIRGLKDAGLRVPQDISVSGFDDVDIARYNNPPLTTVSQPIDQLGRAAMHLLIDIIEGLPVTNNTLRLSHTLVVRDSTQN
ncbi:MAG TPA: LacI family DNA-binding transcriptional regulator [Pseudomonadales bacterium]|nr:LacI family DNA-binding transcriptional regulator [Pseudomonadales bacterium]